MAIIKKFRIKSFKSTNNIIEFRNVSLSYGNRLILDNISFEINEGQIFGMLGPNGVGKSTIFNLITGLISPKYGKIKINYRENEITGDYVDFSLNNNSLIISKNVVYSNQKNLLKADALEIDLETKNTKIFMYEKEKKVKIKSLKNHGNN